MAHIMREDRAEKIERFTVYATFVPDEKRVYIAKCSQGGERNAYSRHYNLRCKYTRLIFQKAKDGGKLPPMYKL